VAPLPLLAQAQPGGLRDFIDAAARTPLSQVVLFVLVLTVVRGVLHPFLMRTPPHKRFGAYGVARVVNEFFDALIYAGVFVFLIIRPFLLQAFLIPTGSMWPTLYVNDFIVANKAIYRYSEPKRGEIVVFRPPPHAVTAEHIAPDGQVNIDYIKRLVGAPGDVVELREGELYLNGARVEEPYRTLSQQIGHSAFRPLTESERNAMLHASFKLVRPTHGPLSGQLIPLNYTQYDANSPMPQTSFVNVPYFIAPQFQVMDQGYGQELVALPAEPVPPDHFLMIGDNRNNSADGRVWGLVTRDSIIGRSEVIWLPFSRWGRTR
jgi:signal peptidase I